MTLPSIITPTAAYVNMRQSENQPVKRQPVSDGGSSALPMWIRECVRWDTGLHAGIAGCSPCTFPHCAEVSGRTCYVPWKRSGLLTDN